MMKRRKILGKAVLGIIVLLFMIIWIYPFLNIVFNSFKSLKDMMTQFMALPQELHFENYSNSWEKLNFLQVMLNTLFVTIVSVGGMIFFGSMAAYKMARTKTRYSQVFFVIFLIPMLVPFQTIMITLTQIAKLLHLNGSLWGLSVLYWGTSLPFVIFLYHGFIKSVPVGLDESAMIDGASPSQVFFKIIFPLLKPITTTAIVINALYVWNDFLLPLLMVSANKSTRTIQLALYSNFGSQGVKWEVALPGIVIAMIPAIIFFIALQKHIIKGIAAGAVKG